MFPFLVAVSTGSKTMTQTLGQTEESLQLYHALWARVAQCQIPVLQLPLPMEPQERKSSRVAVGKLSPGSQTGEPREVWGKKNDHPRRREREGVLSV